MEEMKIQMSESFGLASILAMVGGFLDSYTYICRDHVFANAQTGNIVQVGICLAKGNITGMLRFAIPIIAFMLGTLLVLYLKDHNHTPLHWRQLILLVEIAILIIVAFLPIDHYANILANVLVSFSCAMQAETFGKVLGKPFSSIMCTGNLKSGTEHLYHLVKYHDHARLEKAKHYFLIIFYFIMGATLGAWFSYSWVAMALLLPAVGLLLAILLMRQQTIN
ncbi:MAG: DUF1275 domain-containing protein [Erysipelotrichaceae bacterium]|nr:DUF1275 domain-containing protein [Erysipelotrichaceae bacterium]MDY5252391.1 YoaK family protein [Erysipelotrichaceae bacterium]